jgi:hypothetical protein
MTTYGYPAGGTITKAPDTVTQAPDVITETEEDGVLVRTVTPGAVTVTPGAVTVTPGSVEAGAVLLAVQSAASHAATHGSVQALWVEVPDGTLPGAVSDGEGGWANPDPDPVVLTPMQFYLAFTPAERVAIKASTNPLVQEFWQTFELAVQTNTSIHTALQSVVDGVNALATAGLIAEGRVADILAGVPQ